MTESIEKHYEWLIIFLVYNNNYYDLENQDTKEYYTMKEQTKYILSQVRYSNHSQKVKTIFVEAEIKNEMPDRSAISPIQKNPVATLSMLYKKQGTWLSAVEGIWREGEEVNILTNGGSLQKILMRLKNRYNADKHMIVTAGHGSIVGINYYIPELIQKASRPSNGDVEKIFEKEKGINDADKYKEELDAEIKLEEGKRLLFLANQEICHVIKDVFADKKLDVLVMYNCLMQNIFTQFELRETVDWLVAPLSGISIPGFNYKRILNEISDNPLISPDKVAELFTSTIRDGNRYTDFMKDIEGTWKIAASKMDEPFLDSVQQKLDALFTAINSLAESNKETEKDISNCIRATLRFLFNYAFYCLKSHNTSDLGVFLEFFKEKIGSEYNSMNPILPKIDDLQVLLKNKGGDGLYLFVGSNFYNNGESHKEDEPRYKNAIANIALFLPFKKFHSNLIRGMLDSRNYPEGKNPGQNNYAIPSLLKSDQYASTISKVVK